MSSENEAITQERLSKLSRRAIVAFAVRCARRVEPLLIQGFDKWGNSEIREEVKQIDNGLVALERWCARGSSIDDISTASGLLRDSARAVYVASNSNADAHRASEAATEALCAAAADDAASNAFAPAKAAANAAAAAADAAAAAAAATVYAFAIPAHDDAATAAASRDINFLESAVTADGPGGWIDPTDEGPMGPIWGDAPPVWYREGKSAFDRFFGRMASSDRPTDSLAGELERSQKELEATRQQFVSAQERVEARQAEVARLEASFGKQSEALQKYEENLVAQREQLTKQQEHAAELQKRLSDAVTAAAEAQAARDLAEADAKNLELELARKQNKTLLQIIKGIFTGEGSTADLTNLTLWVLMGLAGILVFVVLSEISSRQQLEALINNELGHVRSELAKSTTLLSLIPQNDLAGTSSKNTVPPPPSQLAVLEQGLKDIRRLITVGTNSLSMFASEISERTRCPFSDSCKLDDTQVSWLDVRRFWRWTNSEFLLALVVSACGGIGSLISLLRDDDRHRNDVAQSNRGTRHAMECGKNIMLGLSTGFLAFFIVRGGKAVFLLQGDSVSFPTNPYTTSFAGLIAGVFTERAYGLLMEAVTQLENKIRQVINDPPTKKPDPKPVDPPTT